MINKAIAVVMLDYCLHALCSPIKLHILTKTIFQKGVYIHSSCGNIPDQHISQRCPQLEVEV